MTTKQIIKILKSGGVGVIPTDTIYGLVAVASDPRAVERVYKLKKRALDKPCIILIGQLFDLKKFGIIPDKITSDLLNKLWPGKVSVILPLVRPSEKLDYLHRGTNTLAFRLPASIKLRNLIERTGPLVAPSVNPEGQKPANTIAMARKYFGEQIDFYLPTKTDRLSGRASTLVAIQSGKILIVRQGTKKII